jgi:hypothetical protein
VNASTGRPSREFPFRVGARSRPFLRIVFGVRPSVDRVRIDDEAVDVRYGRFRFRAPLANITGYRIEGPWRWITAIGVRRSIRHGDVSFAASPKGGVRLDFRDRIHWTIFNVPAIYVAVEDLEGFAAELEARDIRGVDARKTS